MARAMRARGGNGFGCCPVGSVPVDGQTLFADPDLDAGMSFPMEEKADTDGAEGESSYHGEKDVSAHRPIPLGVLERLGGIMA